MQPLIKITMQYSRKIKWHTRTYPFTIKEGDRKNNAEISNNNNGMK